MPRGSLERAVGALYALSLLLAVVIALLAPLHVRATSQWWVRSATVDGRMVLAVEDPGGIGPGDEIPLYRFHREWSRPIGTALVVEQGPDGLVAEARAMRFPLGRHGRVVEDRGERLVVAVDGAEVGQRLYVFDGERKVADLLVRELADGLAQAEVKRHGAQRELVGLVATEYTVPTRAAAFDAPWLGWVEGAALAGVVLLWLVGLVHPGPLRLWGRVAGGARDLVGRLGRDTSVRLAFHALIGFPAVWYGGQLVWYGGTWVVHRFVRWLWGLDLVPENPFPPFPEVGVPWVMGALAVAYAGWLVSRRTSPLLALWHALAWRPVVPWVPARWRPYALWALHLVIAWFFASTLTTFLQGNLAEVMRLLQGRITVETALEIARYLLWSLTILGCLFGYGHTVLGILWSRTHLRELDFTLGGWVTTAICYGPLLGAALERVTGGHLDGAAPVITAGPLYHALPWAELLFNALYTASIWNLGRYFGVMADKGVKTDGFYATVRHPSYTLEALMFAAIVLPHAATATQWVVAVAFCVKYWLRSEREDQFMTAADPAYLPYRERVRWKFVPGLY